MLVFCKGLNTRVSGAAPEGQKANQCCALGSRGWDRAEFSSSGLVTPQGEDVHGPGGPESKPAGAHSPLGSAQAWHTS